MFPLLLKPEVHEPVHITFGTSKHGRIPRHEAAFAATIPELILRQRARQMRAFTLWHPEWRVPIRLRPVLFVSFEVRDPVCGFHKFNGLRVELILRSLRGARTPQQRFL